MQKLQLLYKLTKSNPQVVTCEVNNCNRAAAKRWPVLPQLTPNRKYKAQCPTCRTKEEIASVPGTSGDRSCQICGTTSPHGFGWLKFDDHDSLCTMCYTNIKRAYTTPMIHILPAAPLARSDMRAPKCALCLVAKPTTVTFFAHKICSRCAYNLPNANQVAQTRVAFFATRYLSIPLSAIHPDSLTAVASQLILLRSIPTLAVTKCYAKIIVLPPGPLLAVQLATSQIAVEHIQQSTIPMPFTEFAHLLFRISPPPHRAT